MGGLVSKAFVVCGMFLFSIFIHGLAVILSGSGIRE